MFFFCDNPDHPHFAKSLLNITKIKGDVFCPACNSFGQYIIDTKGKEYLEKIWSDKNSVSYFDISKSTHKNVWLRCLINENHPDYEQPTSTYFKGCGCPYCSGNKVCYDNSLGKALPNIVDIWSDKNENTPFDYTANSGKKVWLKCFNNIHEDFQRSPGNIQIYGTECPKCMKKRMGLQKRDDLTGRKFGRLTVLGIDESDDGRNGIRYICRCDCENHTIKSILGDHLRSGKIQSCGCYWLERISGENNHNWGGGRARANYNDRTSPEYHEWQMHVFHRDNYTCQCCGIKRSPQSHHIRNFASHPELRFEPTNGITLCKECHAQSQIGSYHRIYGTKDNTPEQLERYINDRRKELGIDEPFLLDDYIRTSEEKYQNMNYERKCIMCGKTYRYCPHCTNYKTLPKWKTTFDSEACRDVFKIIAGWRDGSVSKDEAKERLMALNLTDLTFVESVQAAIDEIMAEPVAEVAKNGTIVEVEDVAAETLAKKKIFAEAPVESLSFTPASVEFQEIPASESESAKPRRRKKKDEVETTDEVESNVE